MLGGGSCYAASKQMQSALTVIALTVIGRKCYRGTGTITIKESFNLLKFTELTMFPECEINLGLYSWWICSYRKLHIKRDHTLGKGFLRVHANCFLDKVPNFYDNQEEHFEINLGREPTPQVRRSEPFMVLVVEMRDAPNRVHVLENYWPSMIFCFMAISRRQLIGYDRFFIRIHLTVRAGIGMMKEEKY